MLRQLKIQNIALISAVEMQLSHGFTTITGETGAGKSILMDALGLTLGARSDSGLIRHGTESASVEALFDVSNRVDIKNLAEEYGIVLEDGELVLRRFISPEKSRAFINGSQVNLNTIKAFGDRLVDIHGQHDHQQIMNASRHAAMLDTFGKLNAEAKKVKETFAAWRKVQLEYSELKQAASTRVEEQDLWRAFVEEIDSIEPVKGEEDRLVEERKLLMSGEKIVQNLSGALEVLSGEMDISGRIAQAEVLLSAIAGEGSEQVDNAYDRMAQISHELSDVIREIEFLGNDLEPDAERLTEVDDRLFKLRDLARKHQTTIDGLNEVRTQLQNKLDNIEHLDERLSLLQERMGKERVKFEQACSKLSEKRKKIAQTLSTQVQKALIHLEMPNTIFEPALKNLPEDKWNENGAEAVQFLVATNKGSAPQPLEKVASGGEISRLMLALKQVFYADSTPMTLVFDEVDTGVSGSVAEAMAEAMDSLAKKHQVFAITHLPQVAAMGNQHIFIRKFTKDEQTFTELNVLSTEARVEEVARMIAGKTMTDEARAAAQKLLG